MRRVAFSFLVWLAPVVSLAASHEVGVPRYTDVTEQTDGAVAIGTLTEMGILRGNPDGTYRPYDFLNRAEFVKIVMGFVVNDEVRFDTHCFPDVPSDAWYAEPVCRAKALGIVRGDVLAGVPPEEWPFAATRNVNFAEAVKMLVELFGFPVRQQRQGEDWYVQYFIAALPILGSDSHFDLLHEDIASAATAGRFIARWEMARLAALFLAYDEGKFEEYRAKEDGLLPSSSSVSSLHSEQESSFSSAVSVSSAPVEAFSSAVSSAIYDSDSDVSQRAGFLRLGDSATQVLAAVSVFSNTEPLVLHTITITLNAAVSSVDGLLVYDHFGRYVGRAYQDSGAVYKLSVRNKDITVLKREEYSFYIRARLKAFEAGGVSGEIFRVATVAVEGDGVWSNHAYTRSSSDTFPEFQTARSIIAVIDNPGEGSEPLVGGSSLRIGTYRFRGTKGDGAADLAVTDVSFSLVLIGGVTVSNAEIGADGVSVRHRCSVATSTITCSAIPDSIGSFEDAPITIELFADVHVPGTAQRAALAATINQPGSVTSAGSLTWTDGSTSFSWLPFGAPVVRGTYFEQ